MNVEIEQLIAEVAGRYPDRRFHLFSVQVDSADGDAAKLSGRVLEQENLDALREALAARFPGLRVDDAAVRTLRRDPPTLMTVATNLTDLHIEPSFLSELLTQVAYGVTLEILEGKDKWVFVRQNDGYLGWAYEPYLVNGAAAPSPTHIVATPILTVHRDNDLTGSPVSKLLGGTVVKLVDEDNKLARVEFAGGRLASGWVDAMELRPLDQVPIPAPLARDWMIADARQFTGVYYLWGGCSAFGIDCSGLAQLVHRLSGYSIPRDVDQQFAAGRPVEGDFQPGDLLFFSGEHNRRKISHVGISLGGWKMIHSSRFHNGVYEDDVQQRPHLRDTFAGARTFLRP
ncbi:MAG: C40 family peptidase [Tepidisphaeraceae bacterium]